MSGYPKVSICLGSIQFHLSFDLTCNQSESTRFNLLLSFWSIWFFNPKGDHLVLGPNRASEPPEFCILFLGRIVDPCWLVQGNQKNTNLNNLHILRTPCVVPAFRCSFSTGIYSEEVADFMSKNRPFSLAVDIAGAQQEPQVRGPERGVESSRGLAFRPFSSIKKTYTYIYIYIYMQ